MENLKQLTRVAAIILATSAGMALLADLLNKPADQSYIERLITFIVMFSIIFVAISLAHSKNKGANR